jgi:hypothetical protein
MAKYIMVGQLNCRLDDNQNMDSLRQTLEALMNGGPSQTVNLIDNQRLVLGSGLQFAVLFDDGIGANDPQPRRSPVGRITSMVT